MKNFELGRLARCLTNGYIGWLVEKHIRLDGPTAYILERCDPSLFGKVEVTEKYFQIMRKYRVPLESAVRVHENYLEYVGTVTIPTNEEQK